MKNLPTWAIYLISGLATGFLLLLGITGSLLSKDRTNIDNSIIKLEKVITGQQERFESILITQNKQIAEVAKHNERQNHIMDKMCWLMTLSHPERKKLFENYPAIMSPLPNTKMKDGHP